MTDYKEEQSNEIDALESIYPDELTVISEKPFHQFTLSVISQYDGETVENATCDLQFTYTEKYPDELPIMEIPEYENIDENEVDELLEFMKEQAEENLGMAVVFTVYSAVQEKLTDMVESHATQIEDEKERIIQEKEAEERKRFEGTRVTIESFLAWRETFDADMAVIKKKQGAEKKDSTKPTGRELFLTDNTFDDSDVKFLDEDGATAVAVDESLFQDLDDLDLDDELDIDES